MAETVKVDAIADTITRELVAFSSDLAERVDEAVEKTAGETVDVLRKTAPVRKGKYAKSWAKKKLYPGHYVVYSRKPHYRVTHLLEKGHAKRGGGRVQAYPHIGLAEDFAKQQVVNRIEDAVKEAGK